MALTEIYTLPVRIGGAGPVRVISGSLTATTNETVFTPADPNNCVFLVGQYCSEGTAMNFAYLSGSTTLVTGELVANQGFYDKVSDGFIVGTEPGQPLKINASANVTSALFHIIEARSLTF